MFAGPFKGRLHVSLGFVVPNLGLRKMGYASALCKVPLSPFEAEIEQLSVWFFTAAHIDLVLCLGSRIWIWVRGEAQLWRFGKFQK